MSLRDHYCVVGNPIAHSKSPIIHAAFAKQTKQNLSYTAELAPLDGFVEFATQFAQQGGKGMNVTVPFKQEAYAFVDELSDLAQRAGAVNTISFEQGKSIGHNTDGLGLLYDLTQNHSIELTNKHILILGAGGAVRGVLEPLLQSSPALITLANRTPSKAQELTELFATMGNIKGCGLNEVHKHSPSGGFDLIINGTSSSLSGQAPTLPNDLLASKAAVYDMVYANKPTPFMQWGQAQGASSMIDGRGMLIEQAAEAFKLWRGVRPNTHDLIHSELFT